MSKQARLRKKYLSVPNQMTLPRVAHRPVVTLSVRVCKAVSKVRAYSVVRKTSVSLLFSANCTKRHTAGHQASKASQMRKPRSSSDLRLAKSTLIAGGLAKVSDAMRSPALRWQARSCVISVFCPIQIYRESIRIYSLLAPLKVIIKALRKPQSL